MSAARSEVLNVSITSGAGAKIFSCALIATFFVAGIPSNSALASAPSIVIARDAELYSPSTQYPSLVAANTSTDVKAQEPANASAPIKDSNNGDSDVESVINNTSIITVDKISDNSIQNRIQNILVTSGWFDNVDVISSEGIVILTGFTATQERKEWAENVATRTQGVVAVVNKISISQADNNLSPVLEESQLLWQKTINVLPSLAISIIILVIFLRFQNT